MKYYLKASIFGLISVFGMCDSYCVNVNGEHIDLINVNHRIQVTPLRLASRALDNVIDDALSELALVNPEHAVGQIHAGGRNFLSFEMTRHNGDCGFDALSLSRNTLADLLSNAFSQESWNSYNEQQQHDLTVLLRELIVYWSEARNEIDTIVDVFHIRDAFADVINGELYDPGALHDILNIYIDNVIRINNRPNNDVSDLHEVHISLISYILGVRIITGSMSGGLEEPLSYILPNCQTLRNRGSIILFNISGDHWRRGFLMN